MLVRTRVEPEPGLFSPNDLSVVCSAFIFENYFSATIEKKKNVERSKKSKKIAFRFVRLEPGLAMGRCAPSLLHQITNIFS